MIDFLNKHLTEIITAITGVLAWFFERKKRKIAQRQTAAQTRENDANADNKVIDLYQDALDDLKQRYDEKFDDLKKEIESLKKNQELWKTKYRILKQEFDTYKRAHP